jgi:hypothetical protein
VAEHERERDAGGSHQAVDRVQVGRADARAADLHEHLVGARDLGGQEVDQSGRSYSRISAAFTATLLLSVGWARR